MQKVLFVSNTANFSKFNLPYMNWFKQQGWQVDYSSPGEEEVFGCDNHYKIEMDRSPYSVRKNFKAYKMLELLISQNNYHIIHCHTPMGGLLARLAARKARPGGTKVIYTAHGFHFFKNGPILNWLIYYPIEKFLGRYTDYLVTINQEDYEMACEHILAPSKVHKIDGVGVNLSRFKPVTDNVKTELRLNLGLNPSDFVILYIAEFIKRKNHKFLLHSIPKLIDTIPSLKVLLAGKGETLAECKDLVRELGIESQVQFLGYRRDIDHLCQVSDIHVATSLQEGQGINNIEAMACGIPVLCSRIRGHVDVVKPNQNGLLFPLDSPHDFEEAIVALYHDPKRRQQIGMNNIEDASKFSLNAAVGKMAKIYLSCSQFEQGVPVSNSDFEDGSKIHA